MSQAKNRSYARNITLWTFCEWCHNVRDQRHIKICTLRFEASLNSFWSQNMCLGFARRHRDSTPPSTALGATDRRLVLARWFTSTLPTSSLPGPGCRIRTLVTAARQSLVGSTVIARSLKSGAGSGRSRPLEPSPSRTWWCWCAEQTLWNRFFALFGWTAGLARWNIGTSEGPLLPVRSTKSIWEEKGRLAMIVISTACCALALLRSAISLNFQKTTQAARKRKKQEKKTEKKTKRSMCSWSCRKNMFPKVGSTFFPLAPWRTR